MRKTIYLTASLILLSVTAPVVEVHAQVIDGGVFSRILCQSRGGVGLCPSRINQIDDIHCVGTESCNGLAQTQLDVDSKVVSATSVGYSGPGLTPDISSYAFVPSSDCVDPGCLTISGVHWGFQRYTLNGMSATVRGTLTFSRSAQGDPSFSRAAIMAFKMDGDMFDLRNCSFGTTGYLVLFCLRPDFASGTLSGLSDYREAVFEEFSGLGPAVVSGRSSASFQITGNQGDTWFVGSYMHYRNTGGNTYYDSRNTLTVDFADPTSIEPSLRNVLPPGGTAAAAPALLSTDDLLQALVNSTSDLNIQAGISNALDAKMQAVTRAIDDLNQHNDVAAINSLTAFIYFVQAQRGNQIADVDADNLIQAATAIISSI